MTQSMDQKQTQVYQERLEEISRAWNLTQFQRDKSNESMRFVDVVGGQWEGRYREQFANRPRFELDITSQAVNMFNAEWRKSRFAVKYRPDDTKTSEDDAELLNKLYRTDYRNCNGNQAIDTAVDEMAKSGIGHVRLKTKFVSEDDPEDKRQVAEFEAIENSYNMVIWDANSKKQDKSDANWCAIITTYTPKAFEKAYPDADLLNYPFKPRNRSIFDWQTMRLVYVCEFYEVRKKRGLAFSFRNKNSGEKRVIFKEDIKDHLEDLVDFGFVKTGERMITKKFVEKSIMYGGGFLEKPAKIPGDMIPIAPVYGYRAYIDTQEFWYGLVEKNKDPQRALNMSFSNNVENAAHSPKSMPILTAEQVSGLENRWSEQHLGKYNYAVINGRDENGELLPQGPVGFIEPAQVDGNSQIVIDQASNYIQGSSGQAPADVLNPDASGKAIQESVNRINLLTYVPMDNIAEMLKRLGLIYRGVASEIYNEQRFLHLVNEDGTDQQTLLQEFIPDPNNEKGFIKVNDIHDKVFNVIVDTGPSYQNMRRETVNLISEIIQNTASDSPYLPLLYASMIENIEGAGLDDLKDFNRKQMLMNGYKKPETDADREFLLQLQQQELQAAQNQGNDPQSQLIAAVASKENAEALRNTTEAEENTANARNKDADTQKKLAEAQALRIENAQNSMGVATV